MLEELIGKLIEAVQENTAALLGAETKPDKAKPKSKKKEKAKTGGKRTVKAPTVAALKEQAKAIALATDDPKACMEQIRAVVSEVAQQYDNNPDISLDDFNDVGRVLLKEQLDAFVYDGGEPEAGGDGLEI